MKIPNHPPVLRTSNLSLARIVSEDSQPSAGAKNIKSKSSKDS